MKYDSAWIQCNACGNLVRFEYTVSAAIGMIDDGWRSRGSGMYCPECTTWLLSYYDSWRKSLQRLDEDAVIMRPVRREGADDV